MIKEQDERHLIGQDGNVADVTNDDDIGEINVNDDVEDPKVKSALFSSIEQSKEIAANCCQNKT